MQFERLELLIKDKIKDVYNKTVLIVGVGGVGGYALEALVRAGIGKIIIVDNDTIDITNLNRQIIATTKNIGEKKVIEAKKRALEINPKLEIITHDTFLDEINVHNLFEEKIDYIVDACDTISVKKELIRIAVNSKIKIISSMGTGNKMNPQLLEIIDIRKTEYDPIAKIIRKMIRDERIKEKVYVIASKEQPKKTGSKIIASNSFVPATAGLLAASFIINDIVGD